MVPMVTYVASNTNPSSLEDRQTESPETFTRCSRLLKEPFTGPIVHGMSLAIWVTARALDQV
jgi:hypothetical protein